MAARSDVAEWVSGMDYTEKLGLDELIATQALLYDPMVVIGRAGSWDHVVVVGQKGSVYPLGIVGWVPASQLTFVAPPAGIATATVAVAVLDAGGLALSYGTRLPVVSVGGGSSGPLFDTVDLPDGRYKVPAGSLRLSVSPRSGRAVVAQAEQFLGLPYLWAGTSGFGFDCSGLTYQVYRQFGITLPRDAADQARDGTPVARSALQPGDLVFFAFGSTIDHVGIYAGDGMMIDSPQTGEAVELVPLWGTPISPYYAGARRYL